MEKQVFSLIAFVLLSINNKNYAQTTTYLSVNDTRSLNDLPNFSSFSVRSDFKLRTAIGVPGYGMYSTNLTLSPWGDNSGDKNHQLNFNNGGVFYRNAFPQDSQWGSWQQILMANSNGNVGIGTITPNAKLDIFGNAGETTNIILAADYPNSYLWRLKTIDRGNAIDLDFTVSNHADEQEQALRLTASNSGRPEFQLYNNAIVSNNGNVGIGTANPTSKLTVVGNINSREVKVTVDAGADFVFENNYNLPSLDTVDKYIKENKHLPEIASADEMKKDGINLSEMNIKLLQKIEELTLYTIEQQKNTQKLTKVIEALTKRLEVVESK